MNIGKNWQKTAKIGENRDHNIGPSYVEFNELNLPICTGKRLGCASYWLDYLGSSRDPELTIAKSRSGVNHRHLGITRSYHRKLSVRRRNHRNLSIRRIIY
jgi:hypothetical protein